MVKYLGIIMIGFGVLYLTGCDKIQEHTGGGNLSESEIAAGLKEALIVGTDTSTSQLGVFGGYYNDMQVRIPLPEGIRNSINDLKSTTIDLGPVSITGEQIYEGYSNPLLGINIQGLKGRETELIKGINHAAEDAVSTAGPIFVDAITSMSIQDASDILFSGNDHAATEYLISKTSQPLFNKYEPKIEAALQSVKVGNKSVVVEYENFVNDYNAILNTNIPGVGTIGAIANVQTVAVTDLSAFSTQKGLDGLFLKIASEEEDIRKDPLARVSDILKKVFGQLD